MLRKPRTARSTAIAGAEPAAGTDHATAAHGRRVFEPVTALLDLLTAALCAAAGIHLLTQRAHAIPLVLWAAMLLTIAAAGVGGAVKHAFFATLETPARQAVWRATLYAGGLGSSLLLAALILLRLPAPGHTALLTVIAVEFAAFAVWVTDKPDYRSVMLHYLPTGGGAVAVLLFTAWTPYTPWILGAAAAAAAAGTVQTRTIVPHRRFNHNDLAHALTLPALWCLYRAGALIAGGAS